MLVAVVVLGLLLGGLAQASHFIQFGWHRQSRLAAQNEDLDAVDRTLRRLIVQARPGSDEEPLIFAGTAHTVAFTSIMPLPTAEAPSTQRADIELRVDGAHRLVLMWTPHLHATRVGRAQRPAATEILQGVERLELSYWPGPDREAWTSIWRDRIPPRLVQIGIVFSDPGHLQWPGIVIAPMLDPS